MTTNRDPIDESRHQDHLARLEAIQLGKDDYGPARHDKPCRGCGKPILLAMFQCDDCKDKAARELRIEQLACDELVCAIDVPITEANCKRLSEAIRTAIDTEIASMKPSTPLARTLAE